MVHIDLTYSEYGPEFSISVTDIRGDVVEEYTFENRSDFINKLIDLS